MGKAISKKIGVIERAGYSSIEVGNQFAWTMLSTYLAVFYTDVVGLLPAVVSIILLIARIWDGFFDPVMGIIAEKTTTRWGKYRPYLIFGAPSVALFSILTFSKIHGSVPVMIVYATITYILCGMAYSAVGIAQGSLVNVMTRNLDTRVQLNSLRQMGSGISGLVISAVSMPLLLFFGHGSTSSAHGYFFTNILFAVAGTACVMFGGIVCKERVTQPKVEAKPEKAERTSFKESALYAFRNRNVLLNLLVAIFTTGAILGRFGVITYYFIYYLGKPALMAPVMVIYNVFTILAQTYTPFLVRKLGKKKACYLGYGVQVISLIMVFAGFQHNLVLIFLGSALNGMGSIIPGIMYSMSGDIVDKIEVQTGQRADGIAYSMLSLGTKIGTALGGSISIAILGAIGFVANRTQTPATLLKINMTTNLFPIILLVLAVVCIALIDVTDEEAKKNEAILRKDEAEVEALPAQ